MTEAFSHRFARQLPTEQFMQDWDQYQDDKGKPLQLLQTVVDQAAETIEGTDVFQDLPQRNRELVLDMAAYILGSANFIKKTWENTWTSNYWGLYVVGSRARNEAADDSDLDLLSVGTFYRNQGFGGGDLGLLGVLDLVSDHDDVFEGFDLEIPGELPSEYNVGDVDRKYLVRATPKIESAVPVDLSVVDLTFVDIGLEEYKREVDVDATGTELPRIPLIEVAT